MDALSWDPLEMSAERTVAAAAAALMWCGEDSQGVLAHIAGRLAWKMALSRRIHMDLVDKQPELVGMPYGDQPVESADVDLTALPAWAARKWAARVHIAVSEAEYEVNRLTDACERTGYHFLTSDRLCREKAKLAALQTIALWGADPLNLEEIEAAAIGVTTDGITVPA